MKTIDFNLDVLSKSMTLRLKRHAAIAGNIANADTPGYRPTQVSFEEELQKAAKNKDVLGLSTMDASSETVDDGIPRLDGNSVNVDRQMANLSENTIVYNATAEFVARKMRMLKAVIAPGG